MVKQFLKDEKGQTTVEYLLIIAVIVVVISVLGNQLQKQLPAVVAKVFQGVNKKIDLLMNAANSN
jgi:Flp pilus assembly pilin Flp